MVNGKKRWMKKSILFLISLCLFASFSSFVAAQCTTPVEDLNLGTPGTTYTLCNGVYNLNDAANNGAIRITANDVTVICNGTVLDGPCHTDTAGCGRAFVVNNSLLRPKIIGCFVRDYKTAFFINATNATLFNNTVDISFYGFVALNSNDLNVSNNLFYNTSYNYDRYGVGGVIANNKFLNLSSGGWYALELRGSADTDATNIRVRNNTFFNIASPSLYVFYFVSNVTIFNNSFNSPNNLNVETIYVQGYNSTRRNSNLNISNNTIIYGGYTSLRFTNYVVNSTISYNNFSISRYYGVYISPGTGVYNNTIYGNYFYDVTDTYGQFAASTHPSNWFNRTVNGVPQGNFWADVMYEKMDIHDANMDGFGDSGNQYPYNYNHGGQVSSNNVVDYGPILLDSDGDGTPDNVDCNVTNPNMRAPYAGLKLNANTILCSGTYYLNDSGGGILIANADGISIICNGTRIIGDNAGYGLIDSHSSNLSLEGCYLSNYSSDVFVSALWNRTITWNNTYNDILRAIAVDDAGNTYASGNWRNGSRDVWGLVKYAYDGTQLWNKSLNWSATASEQINKLEIGHDGYLYAGGYAAVPTTDFGIVKYDTDGNIIWKNAYYWTASADMVYGLGADSAGNVYVAGECGGSTWGIMKLDSSGNQLWNRSLKFTTTDNNQARGLAVNSSGDFYTIGQWRNSFQYDWAIAKYNSAGVQAWNRTLAWNATMYDDGSPIGVVMDNNGAAYIFGTVYWWAATLEWKWGLAKYDASGNQVWNRSIDWNLTGNDTARGIDISPDGNTIYLSGDMNHNGHSDMAVAAYDLNGNQLWNRTFNHYQSNYDVAADSLGALHLGGVLSVGGDYDWLLFNVGSNGETEVRNVTLRNNSFIDSSKGVYFAGISVYGLMVNNTLSGYQYGVYMSADSINNSVYHNNFTTLSVSNAYAASTGNKFNTTVGGKPQGNYWIDVALNNLAIMDADDDGWGDSGTQYPYNLTKGGNVSGYVTDFGPMIGDYDFDGDRDDEDCNDTNSNVLSPRDDLIFTSSTTLCNGVYSINDAGSDGVLQLEGSGMLLNCSGAVISGDGTGSGMVISNDATLSDCNFRNYSLGLRTVEKPYMVADFSSWYPSANSYDMDIDDSTGEVVLLGIDYGEGTTNMLFKIDSDGEYVTDTYFWDGDYYFVGVDDLTGNIFAGGYNSDGFYYVRVFDADLNEVSGLGISTGHMYEEDFHGLEVDSVGNISVLTRNRDNVGGDDFYFMEMYRYGSDGTELGFDMVVSLIDPITPTDLVIDSSDNSIFAGYTSSYWKIVKSNAAGGNVWSTSIYWGGEPTSLTTDSSNNIFVAGSNSTHDVLVKLNSSGTVLWNITIPVSASSIDSDSNGNIFILNSSNGAIMKVDNSGSVLWTKNFELDSVYNLVIGDDDIVWASDNYWAVTNMDVDGNAPILLLNVYNSLFEYFNVALNLTYSEGGAIQGSTFKNVSACALMLNSTSDYMITNNTFLNNALGICMDADSAGNKVYYNNFTGSAIAHAYAAAPGNHFNITLSPAKGNFWSDILTLNIMDMDSDGWGEAGSQYPYNSTNGANVSGYVTDWGPYTTKSCQDNDGDGSFGSGSDSSCAVYLDCDDNNASLLPPRDDLMIDEDVTLCSGTYYLNDSGKLGVVIFNSSDVNISCNGTILVGTGTGYGFVDMLSSDSVLSGCVVSNFSSGLYVSDLGRKVINFNSTTSDYVHGIVSDSSGNIFVIAQWNNGWADSALLKYDSSGRQLWNVTIRSSPSEYVSFDDLDLDSSNNIYIIGRDVMVGDFWLFKFDSDGDQLWNKTFNTGTPSSIYVGADGVYCAGGDGIGAGGWLVGKYDFDGNSLWNYTNAFNASYYEKAEGVIVNSAGDVFAVGPWQRTSSSSSVNSILLKLNASGNYSWNKTIPWSTTTYDYAYAVEMDAAENIYVAGRNSSSSYDWALAKYDSSGTLLWVRSWDSEHDDSDTFYYHSMDVDAAGNIYLAGSAGDYWGWQHRYVVKYNSSGSLLWSKKLVFAGNMTTVDAEFYSVHLNDFGDLYVGGYWYDENLGVTQGEIFRLTTEGKQYIRNFSIINNTLVNNSMGVELVGASADFVLRNNTFYNDSFGVYIWNNSFNGTVYHNNFNLSSIAHAYSAASGISFNYSVGGKGEGNIWSASDLLDLLDGDGNGYADLGSDYPYDHTNVGNVSILVTDYAPRTFESCYDLDLDGAFSSSSFATCPGYRDCADNNSTLLPPRDDLVISSNVTLCVGTYYVNDSGVSGLLSFALPNLTVSCNGTLVVGNNGGLGVLVSEWNITVSGCSFANYSKASSLSGKGQGVLWESFFNASNDYYNYVFDGAADASGNFYVVGSHYVSETWYDWTLTKFSTDGYVVWSRSLAWGVDGNSQDEPYEVAVDSVGYVYVLGHVGTSGDAIAKYDSEGNLIWNKVIATPDTYASIAVDSTGTNIYVAGYVSVGNTDWSIMKINSDGDVLWVKNATWTASNEAIEDIDVGSDGSVYVGGSRNAGGSYYTWAFAKYDSSGNQLWNRTISYLGSYDRVSSVFAGPDDYVYFGGRAYDGVSSDYGVAKYDSSGNQIWNVTRVGYWYPYVVADSYNNVYAMYEDNYVWVVDVFNASGSFLGNMTALEGAGDYVEGGSIDSYGYVYMCGFADSPDGIPFAAAKFAFDEDLAFVSGVSFVNDRFVNSTVGVEFANWSSGSVLRNSTLFDNYYGVYADSISRTNRIYYNNFSSSRLAHAYSSNGTNQFNTTVGGVAQGNYWDDVLSLDIWDMAGADGWADSGTQYPYNATNGANVSGYVADFGPATTKGCYDIDGDGVYSSVFCGGYADCDDNNASVIPPKDNLVLTSNATLCSGTYMLNDSNSDGLVLVANHDVALSCDNTVMVGNNSGYGFSSRYSNVTLSGCTFSNYSSAVYAYLFGAWNLTQSWNSTGDDIAYGVALDSAGNVYVVGSWTNGTQVKQTDWAIMKYSPAGAQLWNRTFVWNSTGNDSANDVVVDSSGNVYIVGHQAFAAFSYHWGIVKYDSAGNYQWNQTVSWNLANTEKAIAVDVDSSGNVYVGGYAAPVSSNNYYFGLVKFDSSGNQVWNRTARFSTYSQLYDIAVDNSNNVFIAGTFSNVSYDWAMMKYDSSGNQLWNRTLNLNPTSWDMATAVDTDSSGNAFFGGFVTAAGGRDDRVLIKYDSSGNQVWNRTLNWNDYVTTYRENVAVDSYGNVYISDTLSQTYYDWAWAKYDNSGSQLWNKTARFTTAFEFLNDIVADPSGNLYSVGYYSVSSQYDWALLAMTADGSSGISGLNITNNRLMNSSKGIEFANNVSMSTISNNTMFNNGYGVYLNTPSINNLVYYNNFTDSLTAHAYAAVSGNQFNTTVGGKAQGNFWDDVAGLNIYDTDGDGWANRGSQYPYASYNGAKVSSNVVDYGPYTTFACYDVDGDGSFNSSSPAACGQVYYDCDDNNATLFAPYDDARFYSNSTLCPGTYYLNDSSFDGLVSSGAQGISLTCDGTVIVGNGTGRGIVDSYSNVTVSGCNVRNYSSGLVAEGSWNKTFSGLSSGNDIDADSSGNIYVLSGSNVLKYTPSFAEVWRRSIPSTTGSSIDGGIDIDSSGNLVVAYSSILGNWNWALAKYYANGTQMWNRSFIWNATANDLVYDVAFDHDDDIIVVGVWPNSTGSSTYDWAIAKFDTDGNYLWNVTVPWHATQNDFAYSVEVDSQNNLFVGGVFRNNSDDWALIKINSSGSVLWKRNLPWSNTVSYSGMSVAVDSSDNVYFAGQGYNTTYDFSVMKLDSSGNQLWNRSINYGSSDAAYDVAVDRSGDIFVVGNVYTGSYYSLAVVKYSSSGNLLLNRSFNFSSNAYAYSVIVDNAGDAIAVGQYSSTMLVIKVKGLGNNSVSGSLFINNTASNNSRGIDVPGGVTYSTFRNNTIINNSYGIYLDRGTDYNSVYYNNFTHSLVTHAAAPYNSNYYSSFNTTVGSVAQGNYWDDVVNLAIADANLDGWGDFGDQYPYTRYKGANASYYLQDFGPYTVKRCYDYDGDGSYNSSSDPACGNFDCDDSDASIIAPRDNLKITQDVTFCSGTYNVTDLNNDGALMIGANNVEIVCNGTVMVGDYSRYGFVRNSSALNFSITGCTMVAYDYAFYLNNSYPYTSIFSFVIDNVTMDDCDEGIYAEKTNDTRKVIRHIVANNMSGNSIYLESASNFDIYDVNISQLGGGAYGIWINNWNVPYAGNYTVKNVSVEGGWYCVWDEMPANLSNALWENIKCNGTMEFWMYGDGQTNSDNVTFRNIYMYNAHEGLYIRDVDDFLLENVLLYNSSYSSFYYTYNATLRNLTFLNLSYWDDYPVYFDYCDLDVYNLTVLDSSYGIIAESGINFDNLVLADIGYYALELYYMNGTIRNLNITNAGFLQDDDVYNGGIMIDRAPSSYPLRIEDAIIDGISGSGIYLYQTQNVTFENITISNVNGTGMYFDGYDHNNTIRNSTFINNTVGINITRFGSSSGNLIYHNSFIDSSVVHASSERENNSFNITVGGYAQGNFWDDVYGLEIYDVVYDDNWGDYGSQYPYNATNGGKVAGNVTDWGPYTTGSGRWGGIVYPEGVYEPYNATLVSSHRQFTLNYTFVDLIAGIGDVIQCVVDLKNGSFKTLNKTVSGCLGCNESLTYTLQTGDANAIKKTAVGHVPWETVNCSLYNIDGLSYSTTSAYGSPLDKMIFVHNNTWSGFVAGGDVTSAALCWLGTKYVWFNNSRQCDFAGDRAYAIALSLGNVIEGGCFDGFDNDGSQKWDCNSSNTGKGTDSFCKGLFYSCGSPEDGRSYDQVHPQLGVLPYLNPLNPDVPKFVPFFWLLASVIMALASMTVIQNSAGVLRYASAALPAFLFICFIISSVVVFTASSQEVSAAYTVSPPGNCDGNICSGTATIGGNSLTYYYTLHNRPGDRFKLRWDDGSVSSANTIIYSANKLPYTISSNGTYNDTLSRVSTNSYVIPYYGINPVSGKLNYVVSDADGYVGDVDGVMWAVFNSSVDTSGVLYFELYASHYGADSVITSAAPLYFDASAPTNDDESFTSATFDLAAPCADSVDNDLDYNQDCHDVDCDGLAGNGAGALCQYSGETNCYDRFDNDFDNDDMPSVYDLDYNTGMDCRDFGCNNTQGDQSVPTNKCYFKNEYAGYPLSCRDGFNNDADDGVGALVNGAGAYSPTAYTDCYDTDCWAKGGLSSDTTNFPCPSRENNAASWCMDSLDNDYDDGNNTRDTNASSGVDCQDYDCRLVQYGLGVYNNGTNNYTCSVNEYSGTDLGTPSYSPDASRCFDGFDNDIDNPFGKYTLPAQNIDCGDSDCNNVSNPSNSTLSCYGQEFNITIGVQACNDAFDNDGDLWLGWPGGQDCSDGDCNAKFGNCGPCPSVENITYDSCADNLNNDYDSLSNCADLDCSGELGNTTGSQRCGVENTNAACSDGFDNDADTFVDCKDAGCVGMSGPRGEICQASEFTCNDDLDNDADGYVDCFDTNCYANSACGIYLVQAGSHFTVPSYDSNPPGSSVGVTTTIRGYQLAHLFVNKNHTMTFTGSSSYDDLFVNIGGSSDPYIYNFTSCVLTGPNASSFTKVDSGGFGYVTEILIGAFSNFNFTLECNTSDQPKAQDSFNVLASGKYAGQSSADEGNEYFYSTLHENTQPVVDAVRVEPSGVLTSNILYGEYVGLVANASDPGLGLYKSDIYSCYFNIGGAGYYAQNDGLCRYKYSTTSDAVGVTLQVYAVDGSDNIGTAYSASSFNINVKPVMSSVLTINKTKPFFKSSEQMYLNVSFITATNGNFASSTCNVTVLDSAGAVVEYYSLSESASGNTITCEGIISAPVGDNMYKVYVNVTDEDVDSAKSNEKTFYVCDSLSSSGSGWTCAKADFDQDGAVEGLFSSIYVVPLSCDNCPRRSNPEQYDFDANGVGDACDLPPAGSIVIYGQNGTEFTSSMNVFLNLSFSDETGVDKCRYANDAQSNLLSALWEDCTTVKSWLLSEGQGIKTVYYQVRNIVGKTSTFNDSINYRFMQDFTAPTAPVVFDGNYSYDVDWWNYNNTISAHWWNSTEDISNIIYYMYRLMENGSCYGGDCNWTDAGTDTSVVLTGVSLKEGWNYSFDVFAYISSGLNSSIAWSNGTIIDITKPSDPIINSTTHPVETVVYANGTIKFNFTATDPISGGTASGIEGYSYAIDSYPGTAPDSDLEDRQWFLLRNSKNDGNSQVLRANSSFASPNTYAVFSQINENFTAGEVVRVRATLAERLFDSGDLMDVQVYLVRVPNGNPISSFNNDAFAITESSNITRDIRYSENMQFATMYEFTLTLNTSVDDALSDTYVVISGSVADGNNKNNLSIALSNTNVDNSTKSFVCSDAGSCTENTYSVEYAVEVKSEDSGAVWDVQYDNFADGIYYFHVKAKDIAGNWGETSHYKVMIERAGIDVSILSPESGQMFTEASINVTVQVSRQATVDVTALHPDGSNSTSLSQLMTGSGTFSVTLERGANRLYARAINPVNGAVTYSEEIFVVYGAVTPIAANRTLKVKYTGATCNPLEHICLRSETDLTVGIASENDTAYFVGGSIDSDTSRHTLKIFAIKPGTDVSGVESDLADDEFLDRVSPMFGYKKEVPYYIIRTELRPAHIYFEGERRVSPGSYILVLKNLGVTSDGKVNMSVSIR